MSKVSICIPAYNNGEGVRRLLNSIKEQSYSDYEIILTDDSTTDDVKNVVDESGALVKYVKNANRDGSTANWNKALDLATGEYIKIMHHDDWFTGADSLGKMVRLLDENPEAILAFSGTMQVSSKESFARHISDADAEFIRDKNKNLFLGNAIGAPSAVIHRKTDKRYDVNLKWYVDMDFYLSLLGDTGKFVYTNEPLVSIGVSDEQITNDCIEDNDVNIREYKYVYIKHGLLGDKAYRDKLTEKFIARDAMFSELNGTDISAIRFAIEKIKKLIRKVRYKLHAV